METIINFDHEEFNDDASEHASKDNEKKNVNGKDTLDLSELEMDCGFVMLLMTKVKKFRALSLMIP